MVQITAERIEPLVPELLVSGQPHGGLLQRRGRQLAPHDAAFLRARQQSGVFEHAQMLHEAGQRHAVRLRELADAQALAAIGQRAQHVAARAVGQRGEDEVEGIVIGVEAGVGIDVRVDVDRRCDRRLNH